MRATIRDIQRLKSAGHPFSMITAYDYTSAQMVDRAGIPMILVGDTLGMVVLGYPTTVPVTIDEMIHHMKAVSRGCQNALIVGDLPFLTYATVDDAVHSAKRLMQEGGVQAVKLEGGRAVAPTVSRLVELGVPVMAHIGLTPQSVNQLSGMRVQGRQVTDAQHLIEDAYALESAGAFALVLELVPRQLAAEITRRLHIPTIGIGAGPDCNGQVQVWHDILGLFSDFTPRHSRRYLELDTAIVDALQQYRADVESGTFPTKAQSSMMDDEDLRAATDAVDHAREPASRSSQRAGG